jgi:hypothetical protein
MRLIAPAHRRCRPARAPVEAALVVRSRCSSDIFGVRRSAFGVRRSAFGVRRSAFGVRRSAFGVRRQRRTPRIAELPPSGVTISCCLSRRWRLMPPWCAVLPQEPRHVGVGSRQLSGVGRIEAWALPTSRFSPRPRDGLHPMLSMVARSVCM